MIVGEGFGRVGAQWDDGVGHHLGGEPEKDGVAIDGHFDLERHRALADPEAREAGPFDGSLLDLHGGVLRHGQLHELDQLAHVLLRAVDGHAREDADLGKRLIRLQLDILEPDDEFATQRALQAGHVHATRRTRRGERCELELGAVGTEQLLHLGACKELVQRRALESTGRPRHVREVNRRQGAQFQFCGGWGATGGVSIGFAYGVAYYLVNGRMTKTERAAVAAHKAQGRPTHAWLVAYAVTVLILGWMMPEVMPWYFALMFAIVALGVGAAYFRTAQTKDPADGAWSIDGTILERWGAYTGLILGLGLSILNGLKGWANIYIGNETFWWTVLGSVIFPAMALIAAGLAALLLRKEDAEPDDSDPFPHAYGLLWLVMISQNVIAQLITNGLASWNEMAYNIYYVLLFLMTVPIVYYYQFVKKRGLIV